MADGGVQEHWPINEPDKLEDLCIAYFLENIKLYVDKTDDSYTLKPGINFPHGLSDKILSRLVLDSKHLQDPEDNVFEIFNNRARTYLTSLPLRYTAVYPEQLEFLCTHPVREIDITHCICLRANYVKAINQTSKTLKVLKLGGSDQLERLDCLLYGSEHEPLPDGSGDGGAEAWRSDAIFDLPHLQSLTLLDVKSFCSADGVKMEIVTVIDRMIRHLKSLTQLHLCNLKLDESVVESIGHLDLPNLVSLSLSDVLNGNSRALSNLCNMKQLRYLDVSEANDTDRTSPVCVIYEEPTKLLEKLLGCLPHLTHLDMSGTNLPGYLRVQQVSHKPEPNGQHQEVPSGIPGINGRHFEFLGLLNCADEADSRKALPADRVSGTANEDQLLTALHMYVDKSSLLKRTFDCLFNKFRYEVVHRQLSALKGTLEGMIRNKHDAHIQIAGNAILFHIVKGQQKYRLTQSMKRKIMLTVLDAMERHPLEYTMLRNGCLTFSIFKLPGEILFCYERFIRVLLNMLQSHTHEDFLMRLGIDLLNALACLVEKNRKERLGALGTIGVMCSIISRRLDSQNCDVILQNCWSTLWNVTDETEENCDEFMHRRGMYLFLDCFQKFPDKDELLRNMMGLMGNIAEVHSLRPQLMNEQYVTVFADFLESQKDGIEVSYNAAGVFAHMLSDGADKWTIDNPPRDQVIRRMEAAIERWPLTSSRLINYRSFRPILRLVQCFESNTSQHWAVWALCNLTQVYPDKYCPLLKEEGGIELLEELLADPRPKPPVKLLAQQVTSFVAETRVNADNMEMESNQE